MKQNKSKWLMVVVAFFIFGGAGLALANRNSDQGPTDPSKKVTVYKSPTCGCCVKYVAYLKKAGYDVEMVTRDDMNPIKNQYGIPGNLESCHTSVFGDYVVEGHIPIEVVEKMLAEKPDIRGIALPDMPAGSPGMPGTKNEPFTIYSLAGTNSEVYTQY